MCSRVRCRKCSKVTWSGCGAHVDSVMRGVPQEDRCTCAAASSAAPQASAKGSWWSFLTK
ncbi:MAG: hypothetical protein M3Y59_21695 [Myxococcota bacterium]|nr:hypothetical protein [Myxococcota bacterium]